LIFASALVILFLFSIFKLIKQILHHRFDFFLFIKGDSMKLWHYLLVAAFIALPAAGASATTITGRSSTVLEWYDDPDGNTAYPVYQYLILNARDIEDTGVDFRFYGRLGTDLNDRVDADNRLFFAYAEKRGINDMFNVRLGRHLVFFTAGSALMDGLSVDYDNGGPYTATLFGGGDARYYESYDIDDRVAGGKVAGRFLTDNNLKIGLSYFQKWEESATTHQLIGLDAFYDHGIYFEAYGEYQFNYLSNTMSYLFMGVNYHRSPDWQARLEYLYSKPVFSATSIYSVFAVAEYQEIMGQFNYRLAPGMFAFGRLTHEIYEEVSNANVVEAGIEKIRTDRFSGSVAGVARYHNEGQDLYGIRFRAAYLLRYWFQVGGGASIDVLERRLVVFDEGPTSVVTSIEGRYEETTHRIWADATAYFTRRTSLEARIARIESDRWKEYYYGNVRFNYHF
jgi:hypothetical protein